MDPSSDLDGQGQTLLISSSKSSHPILAAPRTGLYPSIAIAIMFGQVFGSERFSVRGSAVFFFFFGIYLCAPRGTESHVASITLCTVT